MLIYLQMIETDEDKTKFAQIYEKYRSLMFSVACRVLDNDADAEDAVHQAFVSIIDNLNKIKMVDSVSTKSYLIIYFNGYAGAATRHRDIAARG